MKNHIICVSAAVPRLKVGDVAYNAEQIIAMSLYNCAVILSAGTVKAVIPKIYLPTYGEFYECRWFHRGVGLQMRL